jgi:hypothetical protein
MDGRFYGYKIGSLRTLTDIGSVCVGIHSSEDEVWESFEYRRACVSGERSTWIYTVDGEDIRSSGLVNGGLIMGYTPRCRCGVQVDR